MEIHHTKHHQAYVDKLNKALEMVPQYDGLSINELMEKFNEVPDELKTAVRNHGGGHANHTFFWSIMTPDSESLSSGPLLDVINSTFNSIDDFKTEFTNAALNHFGSGWAWLVKDSGQLKVISLPNQDSPLIYGQTPILGVDVWEHAYYLRYQNRRADYLANFWKVINWKQVTANFLAVK
jgi:Fe-Mn family superoxide dismutase